MDQEDFAMKIRAAGNAVGKAEFAVLQAEAEEKKIIAQVMVIAEARGAKTNAHQLRSADEDNNVFEARLAKGRARGHLRQQRLRRSRLRWNLKYGSRGWLARELSGEFTEHEGTWRERS